MQPEKELIWEGLCPQISLRAVPDQREKLCSVPSEHGAGEDKRGHREAGLGSVREMPV